MIPASLPMPNQDCLRYRHCTWALWASSRNLLDILLLGRTRGTKVRYSKGNTHVSSPQVLGGVEDFKQGLKIFMYVEFAHDLSKIYNIIDEFTTFMG